MHRMQSISVIGFTKNKNFLLTCQMLILWLVMLAHGFDFNGFGYNEVDILPLARQFIEHSWIPNDWYLNLDSGYRQLFNMLFGPVLLWLGFEKGAILGRLLVYFLTAGAILLFFRTLCLRFVLGLLVLFCFLEMNQSLVAGEWIIGGIETKPVAYIFIFLTLTAFLRQQYFLGFAAAGFAVSFHVLVGLYSICRILIALLLNWKAYGIRWTTIAKQSRIFFITGIFGLQSVIGQLSSSLNPIAQHQAFEVYIKYRNPHHLLPAAWLGQGWKYKLVFATGLFLVTYFLAKSRAGRFIAAYGLGLILLFTTGLLIYKSGNIELLRFYWFRLSDTMIPFLSLVLVGLLLNQLVFSPSLDRPTLLSSLYGRILPMLITSASVIAISISLIQLKEPLLDPTTWAGWDRKNDPMLQWVSQNTPKDTVFLVEPGMANFYIYAQRSMFVSFKHVPIYAASILEWYKRIELVNGNHTPAMNGFASLREISRNFYSLDEESIRQIAQTYHINYYLGRPQHPLNFERVHSTADFILYKIDNGHT